MADVVGIYDSINQPKNDPQQTITDLQAQITLLQQQLAAAQAKPQPITAAGVPGLFGT